MSKYWFHLDNVNEVKPFYENNNLPIWQPYLIKHEKSEKKKKTVIKETLITSENKKNDDDWNQILSDYGLNYYKNSFMKNGLCKIEDFNLISNRKDLNQLLNDLKLPLLIEKKFIQICRKYCQFDDFEGI